MRIFQSMLTALVGTPILNGPLRSGILGKRGDKSIDDDPHAAVAAVLNATGDVSSLIYAETLLDQIEAMDDASLDMLVTHIASDHDLNAGALSSRRRKLYQRTRCQRACKDFPSCRAGMDRIVQTAECDNGRHCQACTAA